MSSWAFLSSAFQWRAVAVYFVLPSGCCSSRISPTKNGLPEGFQPALNECKNDLFVGDQLEVDAGVRISVAGFILHDDRVFAADADVEMCLRCGEGQRRKPLPEDVRRGPGLVDLGGGRVEHARELEIVRAG
jgi:hypothetical protein